MRRKKIKNNDKIINLERELVKIKNSNKPDKVPNALKQFKKIHVVNKNLHECKNEIILDYTGEFEMVGELSIADHIRETYIRFRNNTDYEQYIKFRNNTDYEQYIKAIDQVYESEDAF